MTGGDMMMGTGMADFGDRRRGHMALARWLALLTPALLLGGALFSQYVGGLYPCEMCMWQRWPHLAALLLALGAIAFRSNRALTTLLLGCAALAIAVSGAIGLFHAGVEYGWWKGVTACTANISGATPDDMLASIMDAPITRCDVAPWSLFGISLAGYNAIFSMGLAVVIGLCLTRGKGDWH